MTLVCCTLSANGLILFFLCNYSNSSQTNVFNSFLQKLAFSQAWLASCESFCEIMEEFSFCLNFFVFAFHPALSFKFKENAWQGCTFPPDEQLTRLAGKNVWQYLSLGFVSDCLPCSTCPKSIQRAKGDLLVVFSYQTTFLPLCLIAKKQWRKQEILQVCVLFCFPSDCAAYSNASFGP